MFHGINVNFAWVLDSSPKDLGLGKVLELLQLMESKLERNAKEGLVLVWNANSECDYLIYILFGIALINAKLPESQHCYIATETQRLHWKCLQVEAQV